MFLSDLFSVTILLQFLPVTTMQAITQEGGPVEMLSAIGYVVCVAALLIVTRMRVSTCWHAIIILLSMGARELDFQKILTTQTITKGRYYFNPDNPLLERFIVVALLLLLVYAVVSLFRAQFKNYFISLKRRETYAIAITMAGALVVVAKLVDGAGRKLGKWNIQVSDSFILLSESIEEILEMGIPILLLVAILALPLNRKRARQDQGED